MLMIYMQNKNIPPYLEKSNYGQEKNAGRRAARMFFLPNTLSQRGGLAFPIGNASFREVVGGEFHGDLVSGEDADEMHAHFSGDMRDDFMAVLQCDDELCVGQQFFDDALHFYAI